MVRHGKECQIWSVDMLANRLIDMRELYSTHKQIDEDSKFTDPLHNHSNVSEHTMF